MQVLSEHVSALCSLFQAARQLQKALSALPDRQLWGRLRPCNLPTVQKECRVRMRSRSECTGPRNARGSSTEQICAVYVQDHVSENERGVNGTIT